MRRINLTTTLSALGVMSGMAAAAVAMTLNAHAQTVNAATTSAHAAVQTSTPAPAPAASTPTKPTTPAGTSQSSGLKTTTSTTADTPSQSSAATPAPAPAPSPPAGARFSLPFYTELPNDAVTYAQNNPGADGAALIRREGQTSVAHWFGDWTPDVQSATDSYIGAAARSGQLPVLVLYAIPHRDCGSYSAGGLTDTTAYVSWVRKAAAGIGGRQAIVVVEPDALAGLDCLGAADQQSRYSALSQAVSILKANAGSSVYLDAGNPTWQTAATMASRLQTANVAAADGFSLNVSNYISTARNQTYGDQIAHLIGNKHYIVDTSRNGNGNIPAGTWCNANGAALGTTPTASTGDSLNDALLWIKIPWESDGPCNGGPAAGSDNWPYAVSLARNAGW